MASSSTLIMIITETVQWLIYPRDNFLFTGECEGRTWRLVRNKLSVIIESTWSSVQHMIIVVISLVALTVGQAETNDFQSTILDKVFRERSVSSMASR